MPAWLTRLDPARVLRLLVVIAAVVLLWDTPLLVPLKVFVVFLHELSHAVAAWLTGGEVLRIDVRAGQSGVTTSRGGIRWIVASAGYLGSMAWGAALLVASARIRRHARLTGLLAVGLAVVALGFVRPLLGFGFPFTLLTAGALLWLARRGSHGVNQAVLDVVGVTSCLYAVLDIRADVLMRPGVHSDAVTLSQLTGLPSVLVGGVWILLAVAGTVAALVLAGQRDGASPPGNVP